MEGTDRIKAIHITREVRQHVGTVVAREFPMTIILNGTELVTLLCSPSDLRYLALGFLTSEGILKRREDLKRVIVDERKGIVHVEIAIENNAETDAIFRRIITPGCGRGASFYSAADTDLTVNNSTFTVRTGFIMGIMSDFQRHSELYKATHCVHSAALSDGKTIIIFREDIGRHNAIDKIFGQCFEQNIPTGDKLILSSGRISSEIIIKITRGGLPVIVTKSVPTDAAVKMADELGITLIGLARSSSLAVFTKDERVVTG